MVVTTDMKTQIQNLLSDAVTVLCKNTLLFHTEMCVEGLLGITLDKKDIVLINIKEIIDRSSVGQDTNATCRECCGVGRIVTHPGPPTAPEFSMPALPQNLSGHHTKQASSTGTPSAPSHIQRQVCSTGDVSSSSISRSSNVIQNQNRNAATFAVPHMQMLQTRQQYQRQQQQQQQQQILSHTTAGITVQNQPQILPTSKLVQTEQGTVFQFSVASHGSEDEVAATFFKKPRICRGTSRNPIVQTSEVVPPVGVSVSTPSTAVVPVMSASVSPQQKHVLVKKEREVVSGMIPDVTNSRPAPYIVPQSSSISVAAPLLVPQPVPVSSSGSEQITIKRTISQEPSQTPPPVEHGAVIQQMKASPDAGDSADSDEDRLHDINNPNIPSSEDFYAFFSGKNHALLDISGMSKLDSAEGLQVQYIQDIEPGELMTDGHDTATMEHDRDNFQSYLGSIEISPKSSSEADTCDKTGAIVIDDEDVISDIGNLLEPSSQAAVPRDKAYPRKLLPEDVVSAHIVLLDGQSVNLPLMPSGQSVEVDPNSAQSETVCDAEAEPEEQTVIVESVRPARKTSASKTAPKLNPVIIKKPDPSRSQKSPPLSKKFLGNNPTEQLGPAFPKMESLGTFRCPFCSKVFVHRASLVRHKRVHKGKSQLCFTCGKRFHRKDVLNRHIRMHKRMGDWLGLPSGEHGGDDVTAQQEQVDDCDDGVQQYSGLIQLGQQLQQDAAVQVIEQQNAAASRYST